MKAVLVRLRQLSNHLQTCGRLILLDTDGDVVFQCAVLELPWKNNLPDVSCIPTGCYHVKKTNSPKFGPGTFELMGVPGRKSIRIHPGNFTSQIEGCLLPGEAFKDINSDSITDVVNSKATVEKLKKLTDSFELTIIQI
ncbi:MAG: hypothetical protein JXQ80_12915 [Bacteroidales bacterium]|nr:hypothetical protein [Bacteroidales bacterium]